MHYFSKINYQRCESWFHLTLLCPQPHCPGDLSSSKAFKIQSSWPTNGICSCNVDYTLYGTPWQAASKEMGTQKTDASLRYLLATPQERAD